MTDTPYSIRELDSKFERVCDLITEKCGDLGKTLGEVKTQTTITNGRVTKLETVNAERSGSNKVLVAIYGLSIMILVAYLGWVGIKIQEVQAKNNELQAKIPETVRASVAEALLPYAK